jgi:hypothetical protein
MLSRRKVCRRPVLSACGLDFPVLRALTGMQRVRLLEIAPMCPAHRTLRSEVHITAPGIVEDDPKNV